MANAAKVFFIGDVALDEYYRAPSFPRIGDKAIVHALVPQMGGMIANAACVYASLAPNACFLTALNSGAISRQLCDGLQEAGLDVSQIVWNDSLPDSKTIIFLTGDEHTVFIPTLNLQLIDLSPAAMEAVCASDYLYSTFCELRPLSSKDLDATAILSRAKARGCRLWCDLDVADIRDEDERFFEYTDALFVNEVGFQRLAARAPGGDVPRWLFSKGTAMLVVTKASRGCVVLRPGEVEYAVPGVNVAVVDVTGAGDTFCASFLYARTRTDDIRRCAEFANFAAAKAVAGMGARAGALGVDGVLKFIHAVGGDPARFSFLA